MGSTFTRRQFVLRGYGAGRVARADRMQPEAQSQKQDGASRAQGRCRADIIVIGRVWPAPAYSISAAQNSAGVLVVDQEAFSPRPPSPHLEGQASITQVPENKDEWCFQSETPDTMDQSSSAATRNLTEIGRVDAPYPDYYMPACSA